MTLFNQIQIMNFSIKLPSTLILAPAKIITLQVSLMKYLF